MRNSVGLLLLLLLGISTIAQGDAASELAGFSVFDKIDINDLAKSDVKTVHGPPMNGRFLSVQSVYVAPGSPAPTNRGVEAMGPDETSRTKSFSAFRSARCTDGVPIFRS